MTWPKQLSMHACMHRLPWRPCSGQSIFLQTFRIFSSCPGNWCSAPKALPTQPFQDSGFCSLDGIHSHVPVGTWILMRETCYSDFKSCTLGDPYHIRWSSAYLCCLEAIPSRYSYVGMYTQKVTSHIVRRQVMLKQVALFENERSNPMWEYTADCLMRLQWSSRSG